MLTTKADLRRGMAKEQWDKALVAQELCDEWLTILGTTARISPGIVGACHMNMPITLSVGMSIYTPIEEEINDE